LTKSLYHVAYKNFEIGISSNKSSQLQSGKKNNAVTKRQSRSSPFAPSQPNGKGITATVISRKACAKVKKFCVTDTQFHGDSVGKKKRGFKSEP
jgi:hypothetical protein